VAEDRDSQAVLQAYQQGLERIRELEASGRPIEPQDKRSLAEAEAKVAGNDKLKAMMKHQADYLEMMHRINEAMDEAAQANA